ncbi:MAG TPA: serine hydrolase [Acidimicrobiia bacterium]|nr:serine hydrolase [Acidimicrobiia bacterium]
MPLRRRWSTVALGAILAITSLADAGAARADDGRSLQQVVDRLGSLAPSFDSYSEAVLAISVTRLDTGEAASFRGDVRFGPASAVKAVWVLAAIEHSGLDAVEPISHSVIYSSDDVAAGVAIDLAGGLDAINEYIRGLGMHDTDFYEWNYPREHVRRSSTYPGPARGRNLTTTNDMVTFWRLVDEGLVLDSPEGDAFIGWTSGPKAGSDANRIVARLPEEVAATAFFKSGWLPIGRDWQLPDTPDGPGEVIILTGRGVSVGAGVITVPGGPSYAVAITAYDGRSWGGMTSWVEYASCVLYSAIAEEPMECSRSRDPGAIALHTAQPTGLLIEVAARRGFLTVDGWAADPDAWLLPTLVRITVDGRSFGGVVPAIPRDASEIATPRFHRMLLDELAAGTHEVCAAALNDDGGVPVAMGCRTLTVPG